MRHLGAILVIVGLGTMPSTALGGRADLTPTGTPVQTVEADDALAQTVRSTSPVKDVPLSLVLTPTFLQSGAQALGVLLGFTPRDLQPTPGPRAVDVIVALLDEGGQPLSSARQRLDLSIENVGEGVEWLSNVPVKPGRYEVRVGVLDRATGRRGSVFGQVVVPTFDGALNVSGLRLEFVNRSTARVGMPTLRRAFERGERLNAALFIKRLPGPLAGAIRWRIEDMGGRDVVQRREDLTHANFNANDVSLWRREVFDGGLPPGEYRLIVEITVDRSTTTRTVDVTIQ